MGAKDEDVDPGEFFDGEPGDFDASDGSLDGFDADVLGYKFLKVESCSDDADACLAGCFFFIVVRTGEVGAFVVHWYGRWCQSCTPLADQIYIVCLDDQLFFVFTAFDDNTAATRCGCDCLLDRLVLSDADCLAIASVGCSGNVSLK